MKITIVGCGNMGLIYARSFLKYNIVSKDDLLLVEKNETRKEDLKKLNIGSVVVPDNKLISNSDVVILSVKPQDFTELATDLKKVLNEKTILLSIMAGINIFLCKCSIYTMQSFFKISTYPAFSMLQVCQ